MVNVDGVIVGNHRTGLEGVDLNRNFACENENLFPIITAIRNTINNLKE